ncbi:Major capsid protein [Tetrabaena socialis]|uniref:Major capsid protein n=1 Tax=Tetrabaena socialis TaxID=47790 RepID=A0A2J7ZHN7_9CHLO|nr:Major capsid protein [Tetrabaena socialis]|eukprot:PNG99786.1 Major capsid protein [Tetrabaena socialis]
MAIRDGRYFNLVQPYQHHENVPSKGIYVYSFGLRPEEHQPSGTCNFSRIDNATLNLNLTSKTVFSSGARTAKIRVYAVNYNVLRIMSGIKPIRKVVARAQPAATYVWINGATG